MSDNNTRTTDQLNAMDAEELLALGIDEISDLEGYKPFPTGLYSFEIKKCGIEAVGKEEKKTIQLELSLTACDELTDESDADNLPEEWPAKYKENYFLETDKRIGLKAFCTMMRPLAIENGWGSVSEIIEGCVGFSGKGLIKSGSYKKNDEIIPTNNLDIQTVVFE